MRTFILYNKSNAMSVTNASLCLNSFENFPSWKPELFDGYTPKDLEHLEAKYDLKNDRARHQPTDQFYKSKKACFHSHFHLWLKCIEMNEPIAVVEHDTYCVGDLPKDFSFDGIVSFSTQSIFNCFDRYIHARSVYEGLDIGLHSLTLIPPLERWGHCMPGNTAYGITPESAQILVNDCFENGWQQNDVLMSDRLCKIEMLVPSLIVYDPSRELKTSSQVII